MHNLACDALLAVHQRRRAGGHSRSGAFSANSVEAVRTACKQGLGLAMLTYWDVQQEIREGSLLQIHFEDVIPEQLSVTAVLPTRQRVPHRVRLFVDRLEAELESKAVAGGATL